MYVTVWPTTALKTEVLEVVEELAGAMSSMKGKYEIV